LRGATRRPGLLLALRSVGEPPGAAEANLLIRILPFLIVLIPIVIEAQVRGPQKVGLTYGSLCILIGLGIAASGGDRRQLAATVAAGMLSSVYCSVSLWIRRKHRQTIHRVREEALLLGIRIEEVERDVPHFISGNRKVVLKKDTCTKYSLRRRTGGYPVSWSFLMRTKNEGAQYPNGWFFRASPDRPAPPEMDKVLTEIATEVDEDYLEFEGDSHEVAAFWSEWGGIDQVRRVHGWLQALARA
jgi:hypothetical protein